MELSQSILRVHHQWIYTVYTAANIITRVHIADSDLVHMHVHVHVCRVCIVCSLPCCCCAVRSDSDSTAAGHGVSQAFLVVAIDTSFVSFYLHFNDPTISFEDHS